MAMTTGVKIGFSTSRVLGGLLSRLICWISRSPASHVWLLTDEMVLEAYETGVRRISLAEFQKKNRIVAIWDPATDLTPGAVIAEKLTRQPYDYLGLFGMLLVELGRRLKARIHNPFRSSKAQFCSELVCRAMLYANYPGTTNWDPNDCDPKQIWDLLSKDGSGKEE